MLRTLVLVLALGAPAMAAAEEFPQSAVGIEVRGDDGTVIGHVDRVERDANGRIVAAEIAGQEPGNAPYASRALVAEERRGNAMLVRDRRVEDRRDVVLTRTRVR